MALDLNENKDINEKVSQFFLKNKKNILIYTAIFVVFYLATTVFISQGEKKYLIASDFYQKIQLSEHLNDAETIAIELKNNYSDTPYASRASIFLGNLYQKNKDFTNAKDFYTWAADSSPEVSIRSLANYQLGTMLFTQKEYEDSIEITKKINDKGFVGLKNNLLGDLFFSIGKFEDAKKHFLIAYEFYKDKNDLAKVIKIKIDAIGQI
jgi:predicted negative regulator of RcsB-dependent stress response